jgi:hypothetical protein
VFFAQCQQAVYALLQRADRDQALLDFFTSLADCTQGPAELLAAFVLARLAGTGAISPRSALDMTAALHARGQELVDMMEIFSREARNGDALRRLRLIEIFLPWLSDQYRLASGTAQLHHFAQQFVGFCLQTEILRRLRRYDGGRSETLGALLFSANAGARAILISALQRLGPLAWIAPGDAQASIENLNNRFVDILAVLLDGVEIEDELPADAVDFLVDAARVGLDAIAPRLDAHSPIAPADDRPSIHGDLTQWLLVRRSEQRPPREIEDFVKRLDALHDVFLAATLAHWRFDSFGTDGLKVGSGDGDNFLAAVRGLAATPTADRLKRALQALHKTAATLHHAASAPRLRRCAEIYAAKTSRIDRLYDALAKG